MYTHIYNYDIYKYMYMYMYIYTHSYIHTYMYIYIHICIYINKAGGNDGHGARGQRGGPLVHPDHPII